MTAIVWGTSGQRFYEAGTDRGVFYPASGAGVPWNGLKSVKEAPSGGTPAPLYQDGLMYKNLTTLEEFAATVEAFSAPAGFGPYEGSASPYAGLVLTQQPKAAFGMSYRTFLGNDLLGTDLGYKIHIVYNATVSPASRENDSISNSTSPTDLSWAITCKPIPVATFKPLAHIVVDSTKSTSAHLTALQNLLYGTSGTAPSLPTPAAILTLFAT